MDIAAPAGEPFSFEGHLIFLDRGAEQCAASCARFGGE
jgi:hypothetical protein